MIVNERQRQIEQLARQYGIAILYAFGSRAREVQAWAEGENGKLAPGPSDVDIGVKALPGVAWAVAQKVALTIALEDLLGVNRVDLVVLDTADPFVAANVIRGERLYAQDEYLADEYDLYVLRRAGDLIPLEEERIELIMERGR
jgi:predicted nucleotidyltransferase